MSIKQIENIFNGMLGVKFLGVTEDGVVWFNDLYTNSTLALYSKDLSRETIKQKVIASRKTFNI